MFDFFYGDGLALFFIMEKLWICQSCEKRIEEMAASIKNILHHKQTIERIRRDIAVIKEQYLPAQEPVLHKKEADVHMQIKMAQVRSSGILQMRLLADARRSTERFTVCCVCILYTLHCKHTD